MRVLFASGIDGFCHRYAVLHWAEQLALEGVPATVRSYRDPRLLADLDTHDLLTLYRVPHSPWVAHLLARARVLGRSVVFAVDDLIVRPDLADAPPLRRLPPDEQARWREGVARYQRTLHACDAVLVTSEPLLEAVRPLGRPPYVHPAGLSERELALGTDARARAHRTSRGGTPRLGYFSGTATHDDDVATIAPVLAAVLARHPTAELHVVGPLALGPALASHAARVRQTPLVAWPELPTLTAAVDVSLAPLEWTHPFVAAKGAIKYLEAAAVGVPTIASPIPAFRHAIRDGETGLLAADAGEWEAALETLIADPARRARLGAAARRDVETRFAATTQAPALAAILRGIAARTSRAARASPFASVDEIALAASFPGEVARIALEPAGALPDVAIADAGMPTSPLAAGMTLAQDLVAGADGLTRIDVQTVTYGFRLAHTLEARVQRADGSTVTAWSFPAALAPDRGWVAIEFAPEARSAGRRYRLELRARGTTPTDALSFGATAGDHSGDPFMLDGVAADRSLLLRTFVADTFVANALAVRSLEGS